ncbi:phosphatase PAP2 family protein [Paraburkholderia sp. EG285A]|uniref:phosphatase PAP2 family protein n=1 Tax=Paraburkholderia sp. EG285A TaxID=3237009 RepID=UPI0034D1A639
MWSAISNLGDAALTIPLAIVCFVWLTRSPAGARVAISWVALLSAAMLLVGVTKILYAGCGIQIRSLDFRMISGHTMLASAIWPMSWLIVLNDGSRIKSGAAIWPGIVFATAIGISRVFDEAHTVSEVVSGWSLGMLVTILLIRWSGAPVVPPRLRPIAAASLFAVSAVAYGHHAPIQGAIDMYSPWLCEHWA